ncbi:MAG: hypothetical protein HON43_02400 [Alphaproteobacteria bacterium]|nr:hypothetical protein [Alphaproteobacteria bacterium]MBT5390463.1 hypothetical protein [Alphaproteobacteria bacterium]
MTEGACDGVFLAIRHSDASRCSIAKTEGGKQFKPIFFYGLCKERNDV